ncbi:hypothetical protein SAMN02745124_04422, partial [Desulfofustis glycolicus DSM 9705]
DLHAFFLLGIEDSLRSVSAASLARFDRIYASSQILLPDRTGMRGRDTDQFGGFFGGQTTFAQADNLLAQLILSLLIMCSGIYLFHAQNYTRKCIIKV